MKKKILTIIVACLCCLSMTACGSPYDGVHAAAEVTTSTGGAYVFLSVNGTTNTQSGSTIAVDKAETLKLKNGETANVHFFCNTCGHDEELVLTVPFAKLLSCACPEEQTEGTEDSDEDNCVAKEYLCIITEAPEEVTEVAAEPTK